MAGGSADGAKNFAYNGCDVRCIVRKIKKNNCIKK
jgi:hypothetical protein